MNHRQLDIQASRVVKIKIIDADGSEALVGSGFLISSDTILTARHVVAPYEEKQLVVRTTSGFSSEVSSVVGLEYEEIQLDVVALRTRRSVEIPTRCVGATFRGDQILENCQIHGFPRAAKTPDSVPMTSVQVRVLPFTWKSMSSLPLQVTSPLPRNDTDWKGISGAGVLSPEGELLGIVPSWSPGWQGQLEAVPIDIIQRAALVSSADELASLPIAEVFHGDSIIDHTKVTPRLTDIRGRSLFEVLHFRNRVVPFVADASRSSIIDWALHWHKSDNRFPEVQLGVLTGPAGVGKSRIATEICHLFHEEFPGWRAGFISYEKLATARTPTEPLLAVFDYPEREPIQIGSYIARLQRFQFTGRLQAPVRILLLARHHGNWYNRLLDRAEDGAALKTSRSIISLASFNEEQRRLHAEISFNSYSSALKIDRPAPLEVELSGSHYDRPLTVHIRSLLAAYSEDFGDRVDAETKESLLDRLIRRESERWLNYRTESGQAVFDDRRQGMEALCVTTLTSPSRSHLPELLRATETYRTEGSKVRSSIAEALLDLYPGESRPPVAGMAPEPHIAPVEPDLIAAHLLANTPGRREIIQGLVTSTLVDQFPPYHARLVLALMLAADDYPDVKGDLEGNLSASLGALLGGPAYFNSGLVSILETGLHHLVDVSLSQAIKDKRLETALRIITALRLPDISGNPRISKAASDILETVAIPEDGPVLSSVGEALARHATYYWEQQRANRPFSFAPRLAEAYRLHSRWCHLSGDTSESVRSAIRAHSIYRDLATQNYVAYLPPLAEISLKIATLLASQSYKRREARPEGFAFEAIRVFESLSNINPKLYEPRLAQAIVSYAGILGEAGRFIPAIEESLRALSLYSKTSPANPIDFVANIHRSLEQLAELVKKVAWHPGGVSDRRRLARPFVRYSIAYIDDFSGKFSSCFLQLHARLDECISLHLPADHGRSDLSEFRRIALDRPVQDIARIAGSIGRIHQELRELAS